MEARKGQLCSTAPAHAPVPAPAPRLRLRLRLNLRLHVRLRLHEQKAMGFKNYSKDLHARLRAQEGQLRTTNLSWALKRAHDMWKEIDDDHEEMTAKRMKLGGA